MAHMLPRSLRFVAGAPNFGAKENAGHSGRDDRVRKMHTQEGAGFFGQTQDEQARPLQRQRLNATDRGADAGGGAVVCGGV
jgi:hypothetical protein